MLGAVFKGIEEIFVLRDKLVQTSWVILPVGVQVPPPVCVPMLLIQSAIN